MYGFKPAQLEIAVCTSQNRNDIHIYNLMPTFFLDVSEVTYVFWNVSNVRLHFFGRVWSDTNVVRACQKWLKWFWNVSEVRLHLFGRVKSDTIFLKRVRSDGSVWNVSKVRVCFQNVSEVSINWTKTCQKWNYPLFFWCGSVEWFTWFQYGNLPFVI